MNEPSVPWCELSNVYNEKEIVRLKTKTVKACIDISQHYNKVLHACVAGDPEFVSRKCVCVCMCWGGDNFVVQEGNAPKPIFGNLTM